MNNTQIIRENYKLTQIKRQKNIALYFNSLSIFIVIITILLCQPIESKEIVYLPQIKSRNDKILFRLLHQTNNMITNTRSINNNQLICKSIIKNQLTRNYPTKIQNISVNIEEDKFVSNNQDHKLIATKFDSILDYIKGKCSTFKTKTFIYQFCHKQHVRQFDDQSTKYNNAKANYEDIMMGFYSNQTMKETLLQRIQSKYITTAQGEEQKPQKSNFLLKHNHLLIQDRDGLNSNLSTLIQMSQNYQGKIIHSSINLLASISAYVQKKPILLNFQCKNYDINRTIFNIVLVASGFDFIYYEKGYKCDQFIKFHLNNHSLQYFSEQGLKDIYNNQIQYFNNILYGNVEQLCTANKNKVINDLQLQEGQLKQGQYLSLKINSMSGKSIKKIVRIQKIYSSQLIQISHNIGRSFGQINHNINIENTNIGQIVKCQLLFQSQYQHQTISVNNLIVNNRLVQLNSSLNKVVSPGSQIGCIFNISINNVYVYVPLQFTLLKKFNQKIYQTQIYHFNKHISKTNKNFCMKKIEKPIIKKQLYLGKFSKLIKLGKNIKNFKFQGDILSKVYILNIKQGGIFNLITQDEFNNKIIYILSQKQIIKIRQFDNGTKQIIKQNNYYQNQTSGISIQDKHIYLAFFKINNKIKSAVWKINDYVYFPRFTIDQKVIALQRVHGFANLRIIDRKQMSNKNLLAIIRYQQYYQNIHKIKHEQSLFQSYSLNYTYNDGDFCGAPINAPRKTIVTMTCGKSWLSIIDVKQTQPCVYWLKVQTKLLCNNIKNVVQNDDNIPNKTQLDNVIFSGTMCLSKNLFKNQNEKNLKNNL